MAEAIHICHGPVGFPTPTAHITERPVAIREYCKGTQHIRQYVNKSLCAEVATFLLDDHDTPPPPFFGINVKAQSASSDTFANPYRLKSTPVAMDGHAAPPPSLFGIK